MKVVALISGGKDSCFNMMQCIAAGHRIVALANLQPERKIEIDSYMYQSVGYEAIDYIAAAMDLPLYKRTTLGLSKQQGKIYLAPTTIGDNNTNCDDHDEVEDLFRLLKEIKDDMEIEGVSVGAILSDYQRVRVENVCIRLGLIPLAYLWQRDQKELLNEMIKCEIDAIIIKCAALGLDPLKHLGRTLSSLLQYLLQINEKYGVNVCGEGGEYETLTLDCPLFKSRIIIDDSEIVMHTNDPIAPVGYLKLNKLSLELKLPPLDLSGRLNGLPLKSSDGYITDDGIDACDFLENNDDDHNIDNDCTVENRLNREIQTIKQQPSSIRSTNGWLWLGGICGESDDFQLAMVQATTILKSLLDENQQSIQDVCSLTMYISDMSRYNELNKVYCETFTYPNPPTRACVEIPSKYPVIIQALSWSPSENNPNDPPIDRHTMHVQSRSHWAPANIGPYSQAVQIGELIYTAGQIGLIPGNLELVNGGIKAQCQLALRHIKRLLKAIDSNVNLRDVVQGICYVTSLNFIEHARQLWEEKTNNAIVDYVVVTQLPKSALIEWHVWAHRYNNQFEYEETGKYVDVFSISIYRRWNYENNIAAIVCYADYNNNNSLEIGDNIEINQNVFIEIIEYVIEKLKQGSKSDATNDSIYNLTIFLPQTKTTYQDSFCDSMSVLTKTLSLVYTFVPVLYAKSEHTYLSVCGFRNQ